MRMHSGRMSGFAPALGTLDRICGGYARISDDKVGDAHGVGSQEEEIRDFGEESDHLVDTMYVDNDISAFSGAERPAYQRLLADMDAGKIALVIIWHANRLHRSVEEVLAFIKIARARKVRLFSVTLGGEYNLERASGRKQLISDTLDAETESAHRGERIALARKRQARTANWGGGRRPYGWGMPYDPPRFRRVLVNKETREYADVEMLDMGKHNPSEAEEIRNMADQVLAHVPNAHIIADLKKRRVPTAAETDQRLIRRGGKEMPVAGWNVVTVRSILTSPRVSGHSVHRGVIVKRNAWDAIIPDEKRLRIIEILKDPKRRSSPGNTPRWLGSLIFLCGMCTDGSTMRVSANGSGGPRYRCETFSHNSVLAAELDEYIDDVIVGILSRPDAAGLIEAQPDVDFDGLRAEREEASERKLTAARLFGAGTIDDEQLAQITAMADSRIAEIDAELQKATKVDPLAALVLADHVATAWEGTSLGRRREVLRALMTVTILEGASVRQGQGRRIVDIDPNFVKIEPLRKPRHLAVAQAEADAGELAQLQA